MIPPIRRAGALWLLAGLVYLASETVAAAAFPGYSYAWNYISDLGVPYAAIEAGRQLRSPLAFVMNLGGFILDGTLFAGAAITAAWATRPITRTASAFLILAIVHSLGSILVGAIHDGPQELAAGTRHLHVIGAAMAIIGGNAALIAAAACSCEFRVPPAYRKLSAGLGIFGLLSLTMLEVNRVSGATVLPDGLFERGSVYPITIWEIVTGSILVAARRKSG